MSIGTNVYYPEMGDKKPLSQIEATLSYSGKIRLKTPLKLKGRGIKYDSTYDKSNCNNPSKYGWNIYYATENAYKKLETQYSISYERLLD